MQMKTIEEAKLFSSESIKQILERIQRIEGKISTYKPIVEMQIKSMASQEFKKKVCNGPLNYLNAKDGTFLYQCSFQNLKIFDQINLGFTPKENPSIDVCIVNVINFAINCPFAGSDICKLKSYRKEYKENSAKKL